MCVCVCVRVCVRSRVGERGCKRVKCKPREALLSLAVTACGQLWVGLAGCSPPDDATRCSLGATLTGCLRLVFQRPLLPLLLCPGQIKMVSCVAERRYVM